MDWEQPLHFEWQANVWVSCEAEELTSSHFPPPASALLPRLLSRATRALLLSEKLLAGCCGFHCCERWLHRHHNTSLNFKRTHTPKSFYQVLTSPLVSTPEQERTKLLKLSSVANSVNPHHFWEIYLQLSEEIALFLGKKKFFQTEKYPCVVLKCWKCFAIISYNVKQRHT